MKHVASHRSRRGQPWEFLSDIRRKQANCRRPYPENNGEYWRRAAPRSHANGSRPAGVKALLSPGALADEALVLKKRIDAIKDEAIRRRLKTAEGEAGRITLSAPGSQDRTERELLLKVLEITEAEFIARFTRTVQTDWRLTIKPRRQFRQAA